MDIELSITAVSLVGIQLVGFIYDPKTKHIITARLWCYIGPYLSKTCSKAALICPQMTSVHCFPLCPLETRPRILDSGWFYWCFMWRWIIVPMSDPIIWRDLTHENKVCGKNPREIAQNNLMREARLVVWKGRESSDSDRFSNTVWIWQGR